MKSTKKLCLFAILLANIFLINNVKAATLEQTTWDNMTKTENITFNNTINFRDYTISITKTGDKTASFCINNDCHNYTFQNNIIDENNIVRYLYEIQYDQTNNKFIFIWNYLAYTNNANVPLGKETISGGTQVRPGDYNYTILENSNSDYISSNNFLNHYNSCYYTDTTHCYNSYYNQNYTYYFRCTYNTNNNTCNWADFTGSWNNKFPLIFSNTSTKICMNNTCTNDLDTNTGYNSNAWRLYNWKNQTYELIWETSQTSYINRQIQSLDMYINVGLSQVPLQDTRTFKMEYTFNTNSSNAYRIKGYYMYGKVCNNNDQLGTEKTCWWEEVPNTYWNITNDTETDNTTSYTYEFTLNYDLTNSTTTYDQIKLAIEQMPSEFKLKVYSYETDRSNSFDLNVMKKEYSKEIISITHNINGILVDKKPTNNNTINYRFYQKRTSEWGLGLNYFYYYYKDKNTISDQTIPTSIYETYTDGATTFWIETGTILLGENENNKLYIFSSYEETEQAQSYKFYFNTDVYYTISKSFEFIINYTGDGTQINEEVKPYIDNNFIQEEYNNSTIVDLSNIEEIIEEYKQYKEQWLLLFNSVYQYIPNILKNLLLILYTILHCYGIYLIFKD